MAMCERTVPSFHFTSRTIWYLCPVEVTPSTSVDAAYFRSPANSIGTVLKNLYRQSLQLSIGILIVREQMPTFHLVGVLQVLFLT
jgi:hypothetical protein